MPEKINDRPIYSLLEVTRSIQKTLSERYTSAFWVKAEMNKLNYYSHSGHCYPELIEKKNNKIITQVKSTLWRDDYVRINKSFHTVLKEPLKDGIKILFLARIVFDPAYGLSLSILDIDPSYTLGDLEREKQETLMRLRTEGIFDQNKKVKFPLLPQRIAVISVDTSKGYADFLKVIQTNAWNYKFFHVLFPALLQGDKAVDSILHQLKRIGKVIDHFDVVAIVRGGGGDVGLSCYNDYELARQIALFPVPVLTGIGHATNETVAEMVSSSNAITPTKLAEYLLQKFHNFSVPVRDAEKKLIDRSNRLIAEQDAKFRSEVRLFRSATENILVNNHRELRRLVKTVVHDVTSIFRHRRAEVVEINREMVKNSGVKCAKSNQDLRHQVILLRKDVRALISKFHLVIIQSTDKLVSAGTGRLRQAAREIDGVQQNVNNMSPANVLRRGYSITRHNGKAVKDIFEVKSGDVLETTVFKGSITSKVESTKKPSHE